MRARRHFLTTLLALCLLSPSCDESQEKLIVRVTRSVAAVPAVVRLVAPNTDARTLQIIDDGAAAFTVFSASPSGLTWRGAVDAWDGQVRKHLLALNNQRLSAIVFAVDILITQVVVPELQTTTKAGGQRRGMRQSVPVETKFKEGDVKRLEELVGVK